MKKLMLVVLAVVALTGCSDNTGPEEAHQLVFTSDTAYTVYLYRTQADMWHPSNGGTGNGPYATQFVSGETTVDIAWGECWLAQTVSPTDGTDFWPGTLTAEYVGAGDMSRVQMTAVHDPLMSLTAGCTNLTPDAWKW